MQFQSGRKMSLLKSFAKYETVTMVTQYRLTCRPFRSCVPRSCFVSNDVTEALHRETERRSSSYVTYDVGIRFLRQD